MRTRHISLSKSNPLSEEISFNSNNSTFIITNFKTENGTELSCFSIIKAKGVNTQISPFKFKDIDIEKIIDADGFQFQLNCDKAISFDFVVK